MNFIAKYAILSIFLLTGIVKLYSQELRLEEGQWIKISGCSFCLTCECLKCSYDGTSYTNDGTSYSETKYKEIPIIRESTTVYAYCGEQLIGEYYLERNNTCNGGYSYKSDITYLRTNNGYQHNPQINYSNGYDIVRMDAKAYCAAGEKRKTVEEIEEFIANQSGNLAINFPKINIAKSEISDFTWRDFKREGFYSFGKEEVVCRTALINNQRRGKWKFLEDKQLIQIDWEENQYKPANREILSITRVPNGYYSLFSTYENKIFSGPVLKAYKYVDDEMVYEKDYLYLRDNIGLDNFRLLNYCDKCYWEGKEYEPGQHLTKYSEIYGKEIQYTCMNQNQKTYWTSELLETPYLTSFDSDFCLTCKDYDKNSPGYFKEWKSGGEYGAEQCVVFKNKEGKIESRRLKIQDIAEKSNPPDITFAPEKIKGQWNLVITKTHDWNTVDQVKEEKTRFNRSHVAEINFHLDNGKISGVISSRKSFDNNARVYGQLDGQHLELYVEKYGTKKYIIKGDFISSVEFSGTLEPLKEKGRFNNDSYWGTVSGQKAKSQQKIVPASENTTTEKDELKNEKRSTGYEKVMKSESESVDIADYKNLETWTHSNGSKSITDGIATLKPEKKKDAVQFSSPTIVVPGSAKYLYFDIDKSNIKSGIIKIDVKDLDNDTEEEIHSDKIQISLNEINRTLDDLSKGKIPSETTSSKKTKPGKIDIRKYRGKKIQITISYKATGMSKSELLVKSINIK